MSGNLFRKEVFEIIFSQNFFCRKTMTHRTGSKSGNFMDFIEFERTRKAIEGESFSGSSVNPIAYGIERAAFEREKFKRLIAAAKPVQMKTVRQKLERWTRQLDRANETHARFKKMREELRKKRLQPVSLGET
jgi:hypothetical protein